MDRTSRILRLIALLQSEMLNSEEIAEQLKVGRRTVFRDLQLLRSNGIAVCFNAERKSYCIEKQPGVRLPAHPASKPCCEKFLRGQTDAGVPS